MQQQQQQQPQIIYMMMPPQQFQQAPFQQMFQMPMQIPQPIIQPVPQPVPTQVPQPQAKKPKAEQEQTRWRAEPPSSTIDPDLVFSFNSKYQWSVFEKHCIAKMLNRFYYLNAEFKKMMCEDYNQINIIKPYHSSDNDDANKHFNVQLYNQRNASQYPQIFKLHHLERKAKEVSNMFHVYISIPRYGSDDITIYKMTEVQSL